MLSFVKIIIPLLFLFSLQISLANGKNNFLASNTVTWISWASIFTAIVIVVGIIYFLLVNCKKTNKDTKNTQNHEKTDNDDKKKNYQVKSFLNDEEESFDEDDPLLDPKKWEYPRDNLKFKNLLGDGEFSAVFTALAPGICPHEPETMVAVKKAHETGERLYHRILLSELTLLEQCGNHKNIVKLLGVCWPTPLDRELLAIYEYCSEGNLRNFLLKNKNNFVWHNSVGSKLTDIDLLIDKTAPSIVTNFLSSNNCNFGVLKIYPDLTLEEPTEYYPENPTRKIFIEDFLVWLLQVAEGMEFLCRKKLFHADLAARNILLTADNIIKISDFGPSEFTHVPVDFLNKQYGPPPQPVQWRSIEAFHDRRFTSASDVWSFGVVCWEVFTLADIPFKGISNNGVYKLVNRGFRLPKRRYMSDKIYRIMLECWDHKPKLRPTFTQLVKIFEKLVNNKE